MLDQKSKLLLKRANLIMIAMVVIHDADHIRQAICWNYTIGLEVWIVNIIVYLPSLIALYLLGKKRRSAVNATMVNGLLVASAFAKVHLWKPVIPVWGVWNRSFFELGADALSWTILVMTMFVGVGVAMTGAYVKGRLSGKNS
ncbi:hypothetical protein [Epilithonimonas hispanica]|nr:hypothetical protein [Epilithonimonas hispanica]